MLSKKLMMKEKDKKLKIKRKRKEKEEERILITKKKLIKLVNSPATAPKT
jgi:protein subunit release factor B